MVFPGASRVFSAAFARQFVFKGLSNAINYVIEDDGKRAYKEVATNVGIEPVMRFWDLIWLTTNR